LWRSNHGSLVQQLPLLNNFRVIHAAVPKLSFLEQPPNLEKEKDMDKLAYLRKVFAHTAGKTFENYVTHQIWAKVEEFRLYPVTQQYVKRKHSYALMDLYFPQINFAVEIDEAPDLDPIKVIEADKLRMEEIFSAVDGIVIERIREEDYDSVKKQINGVVKKIEEKVQKSGPFSWKENWQEEDHKEKFRKIKDRKKLRTSDLIGFKRIEVTNDIFGRNFTEGYLQWGRSFFFLPPNEAIWFSHLPRNKNWENTVPNDWAFIREKYIGSDEKKPKLKPEKEHNKDVKRYTFARYKNALGEVSYRFIGVFVFKEKAGPAFLYERISEEMSL
jgi:hypothetical protein